MAFHDIWNPIRHRAATDLVPSHCTKLLSSHSKLGLSPQASNPHAATETEDPTLAILRVAVLEAIPCVHPLSGRRPRARSRTTHALDRPQWRLISRLETMLVRQNHQGGYIEVLRMRDRRCTSLHWPWRCMLSQTQRGPTEPLGRDQLDRNRCWSRSRPETRHLEWRLKSRPRRCTSTPKQRPMWVLRLAARWSDHPAGGVPSRHDGQPRPPHLDRSKKALHRSQPGGTSLSPGLLRRHRARRRQIGSVQPKRSRFRLD